MADVITEKHSPTELKWRIDQLKVILKYGSITFDHGTLRYVFNPLRKHKAIFNLKSNDVGWENENLHSLIDSMFHYIKK